MIVNQIDNIVLIVTPSQSKMARAALDWSLSDARVHTGIGRATIARFELGEFVRKASSDRLRAAYEEAGVAFIGDGEISKGGGEGVRIRSE